MLVSSDDETFVLGAKAALYQQPLPAARTGALYNAFSYPTKISPESIALFIATHTEVGAHILDAFAGSGTTGIAALLCERPTPRMEDEAKRLGLEARWGTRHVHLCEIGVLGSFISRTLTNPPDPEQFGDAAEKLLRLADQAMAGAYDAMDPDGELGSIRHIIWSDLIKCGSCGFVHRLWDASARRAPARLEKTFACSNCGSLEKVEKCPRVEGSAVDLFGRETTCRVRVPVEIHGVTGSRKWVRSANDDDIARATNADGLSLPASAPDCRIQWGELYRSGYHKGITHLHHFYTGRNFAAVAHCMSLAEEWPEPMRSALKLLVLSYNASHSTLMTRIVAKRDQKEFSITGAQSGVLYVSGLPVEKNVLAGIRRKITTIRQAFATIFGTRGSVHVYNTSSEELPLDDHSIDYVFTDPPFGDYIPYAEINQLNELWLGEVTNRARETVVSSATGKDVAAYQRSMTAVFAEIHRVLKPTGTATVVFHSAHAPIWRALTEAFAGSGFRVAATSVLDKVQASFKQVVSNISVKGDPLILLTKSTGSTVAGDHEAIVTSCVKHAQTSSEVDVRALFSFYVGACLSTGCEVQLNAADFSRRIRVAVERAA